MSVRSNICCIHFAIHIIMQYILRIICIYGIYLLTLCFNKSYIMKETYNLNKLLLALLFLVTCTVKVTAKIIDNPTFEGRNTFTLSISKIEKTSKETVLYFHAQFIPHEWIQLPDSAFLVDTETDKHFYPIRFEGLDSNRKVYMPESGETDFIIVYPSIPKSVKKMDWKIMDDKSAWQIWGISMDGKKNKESPFVYKVPKAVIDQPKDSGEDFTKDNFFRTDSAYITGYLKGYNPKFGLTTGIIYCCNELTRQDYPTTVKINQDGRFEAKLILYYPIESYIVINKFNIPFYIEPGQHIDIQINMDDLLYTKYGLNHDINVVYTSPTADICKQVKDDFYTYGSEYLQTMNQLFLPNAIKYTPSQVIKKFVPLYERRKQEIDTIIAFGNYTPKAAHLKRNREALVLGYRLLDFLSIRDYYASKDSANIILKVPVEKNFYDFMKEMPTDDEVALANEEYSSFLNRFEYNNTLYNETLDLNCNYSTKVPAYTMYDKFKGTFLWQLSTLRRIFGGYKGMIANGDMSLKPNIFNNPVIKSYANSLLSNIVKAKKPYELPDNEASKMFKKLIAPYKGKYIFIDFWGTSCGPCRAGIKNMAPFRKEMQGNSDFQFLYITGTGTSPSEYDYNEYVAKNLKGVPSVYLNDAEYLYMRELFHFNGIPRYVIVDRDGKIIDENFNYNSYMLDSFLKDKGIKK